MNSNRDVSMSGRAKRMVYEDHQYNVAGWDIMRPMERQIRRIKVSTEREEAANAHGDAPYGTITTSDPVDAGITSHIDWQRLWAHQPSQVPTQHQLDSIFNDDKERNYGYARSNIGHRNTAIRRLQREHQAINEVVNDMLAELQ